MSAPVPDASPVDVSPDAGFEPSAPVASLCGFTLPVLRYALNFRARIPNFPPTLPIPFPSLGLNCSLDNPIDVSTGVPVGGGRKPNVPKDPDHDFD